MHLASPWTPPINLGHAHFSCWLTCTSWTRDFPRQLILFLIATVLGHCFHHGRTVLVLSHPTTHLIWLIPLFLSSSFSLLTWNTLGTLLPIMPTQTWCMIGTLPTVHGLPWQGYSYDTAYLGRATIPSLTVNFPFLIGTETTLGTHPLPVDALPQRPHSSFFWSLRFLASLSGSTSTYHDCTRSTGDTTVFDTDTFLSRGILLILTSIPAQQFQSLFQAVTSACLAQFPLRIQYLLFWLFFSLRHRPLHLHLLWIHCQRIFFSFETVDQVSVLIWIVDKLQFPKSTSAEDTLSSFVVPSAISSIIMLPPRPLLVANATNLDKAFWSFCQLPNRLQSPRFVFADAGTHGLATLTPIYPFSYSSVDDRDLVHLDITIRWTLPVFCTILPATEALSSVLDHAFSQRSQHLRCCWSYPWQGDRHFGSSCPSHRICYYPKTFWCP